MCCFSFIIDRAMMLKPLCTCEKWRSQTDTFFPSVFIFHLTCFWFTNFVRTIAKINDLHFNYLLDKTCPFSFFFKNEGIGFSLRPYIFNVYIYLCLFSLSLSFTHTYARTRLTHTFLLAHSHTYIHTYSHSYFLSQSPTHTYFLETLSRYISRYMVESRFAKIVSAFFFFFFYVPQSRSIHFPYIL